MKQHRQPTSQAVLEPGTAVRLCMPHPVTGGIELAAGSTGQVVESYESELGRRYVLHFDDIETVVFAHEIYPAGDPGAGPGGRTSHWAARSRSARLDADTRLRRHRGG